MLYYDARNQLIQAQRDGQITKFSYEPTGMRAKKESATGTEKYVYDQQNRIVAITDGTNNVKFQIVWGPEAPLLLRDVATGKSYYYVLNGRGDVLQLIDEQGTIVNNYNYDEWGNILNKSEGVKNILRYASEPFDDETGLYYLRARYYDPNLGRFINEDTYEGDITDPLSLNLYTYVLNNPLKYNDPSGHRIASDNSLDDDEQKLIDQYTADFYAAEANNDVAGMQAAHDNAVAVRLSSSTYETVSRTDYTNGSETVIVKGNNGLKDDYAGEMLFYPGGVGKAGGSILGKFTGNIFKSIGSLIGKLLGKGTSKAETAVIGKMADLNKLGAIGTGEFKVADLLPDLGSPKANWKQNSGVLRKIMSEGKPIKDVSPYPMEKAGFLGAERNLLKSKNWTYNNGYWYPPTK